MLNEENNGYYYTIIKKKLKLMIDLFNLALAKGQPSYNAKNRGIYIHVPKNFWSFLFEILYATC